MTERADLSADRRAIRVTGPREGRRRAGFAFGPEAVLIAAAEIGADALVAIAEDPTLKVEVAHDGETFTPMPREEPTAPAGGEDPRLADLCELVDRLNATLDARGAELERAYDLAVAKGEELAAARAEIGAHVARAEKAEAEAAELRDQVKQLQAKPTASAPAKPRKGQDADKAD